MNTIDHARLHQVYPVLRELPHALLKKVEQTATPVHAPAGHRLFDNGSPCTDYPLPLEGTVKLSRSSPNGHELLLYLLHPGESCAITAVALLGETAFPACGTVVTPLTLFGIPRAVFLEMVLESPRFRAFVFSSLSVRMAHLMALVDDVAFHRVDQRLASRLLLQPTPDTATHQMLAAELGTSREVVSRILESFQQSGMVKLGRKRIEVLDRGALQRFQRADKG